MQYRAGNAWKRARDTVAILGSCGNILRGVESFVQFCKLKNCNCPFLMIFFTVEDHIDDIGDFGMD